MVLSDLGQRAGVISLSVVHCPELTRLTVAEVSSFSTGARWRWAPREGAGDEGGRSGLGPGDTFRWKHEGVWGRRVEHAGGPRADLGAVFQGQAEKEAPQKQWRVHENRNPESGKNMPLEIATDFSSRYFQFCVRILIPRGSFLT